MLLAICEDLTRDMETILDLCERFGEREGYHVDALPYAHADKLLSDPQAYRADILLLDIMMPGPDGPAAAGIRIARQMRAAGYKGGIIFTTTSTDYYPEGFEVGAIHYLLKPLTYDGVREALLRALRWIEKPQRMITVPVNRVQVTIAQSAIRYAEVYGRETMLHTAEESLRVLLPLKEIERMLDDALFLRCYRSYIVNMDCIASMAEDHFVLTGGVKIPISLRNRQALKARYFSFRMARLQEE